MHRNSCLFPDIEGCISILALQKEHRPPLTAVDVDAVALSERFTAAAAHSGPCRPSDIPSDDSYAGVQDAELVADHTDDAAAEVSALHQTHEPDLKVDENSEITDDSVVLDFPPPARMSVGPDEARQVLDQILGQYAREGREFAPRDLYEILPSVGRSTSWVRTEVQARLRSGQIEQLDNGRYRANQRGAA